MRRVAGTLTAAALLLTGCCGTNSNCRIGPSTGEVVAATVGVLAAAAVTTTVIVKVERSHHNIKGCLLNTPDGLSIQDAGNHKTYTLSGATTNLTEGTLVRVHGSRAKQKKGSQTSPAFVVQSLKKSYGPCAVTSTPPKATAAFR